MLSLLTTLTLAATPQAIEAPGSIQPIEVPAQPSDIVLINLELDGEPVELFLQPYSLRSADFRVLVTRPDGQLVEAPAPESRTWRGTVTGWADADVTATLDRDGLNAIVADYASGSEWQIQPAAGQPRGMYSVVNKSELPVPDGMCGVSDVAIPGGEFDTSSIVQSAGTGLQLCEIALDADFEFFQDNGSSVTATINDMERIMNRVDNIYVRDCDVTFQITTIVVRSTPNDPYTTNNAGNLLGQFQNEWRTTFAGVRRDLAHLFTGKNLQGGTIGVAFLGAVCSSSTGYGLSESTFTGNLSFRTGLTAHEIGHNFNATHCDGNGDCRIMCSGLGGCQNDVTRFGMSRANRIRNYAASRPCLLDLAPPVAVPFFEEFPTPTISTDLWISNQGVVANNLAVNEPSGANSGEFAAANANQERDDFLISNKILLGGLTDVSLSFFTQHRGVPNGGALDVEIYDVNRDWILLARLISDGVDENDFTFSTVQIPPSALHDEAQLRFRADVDGPTERWFVDDILLDDNSCGGTTQYCIAAANSASSLGAQLSATGSTSIAANDLAFVTVSCPTLSFGIYFFGDAQTQTFLGDGFLCVGGTQFRVATVQADLFGISNFAFDQTNLPPGSAIAAGDVLNFQLWYRDSIGSGVNLSNGLEVEFCP
ncbi:MAG: zinc-dependent metalloprotease family protein [Planctomycetota bacterium]